MKSDYEQIAVTSNRRHDYGAVKTADAVFKV